MNEEIAYAAIDAELPRKSSFVAPELELQLRSDGI
jgi:hypothetical protein